MAGRTRSRGVREGAPAPRAGRIGLWAAKASSPQQSIPRLVGQPVEIAWQHIGDNPQGIEIRFLRQSKVSRELLGGQLVHSMRRRVARAAQKHRAIVYREAPPAGGRGPLVVPETAQMRTAPP